MNDFDNTVNMILAEDFKSAAAAGLIGLGALTGGTPDVSAGEAQRVVSQENQPRGIRNNNPGNIEAEGKWKEFGGALRSDGRFIVFNSQLMGIRAIGKILKTYKRDYNLDTISGAIERWAPPKENNTPEYIKNVSEWTGIDKDQKIDFDNKDIMFKLINAIIRKETSRSFNPSLVKSAIKLTDIDY